MLRVGLTGNVGAGKSTVESLFAEWGATVIDTDELARAVVQPGSDTLRRIEAEWGDRVMAADGGLDRAAMRRLAFTDPAARRRLEEILHPAILQRCREAMIEAEAREDRIVIAVVPLLFETGMEDEFDVVLLVDAPLESRIQRLVDGRGLAAEEARAIAAAQMPAEQKRARAHLVLDNDSDMTVLERRAWEVWKELERLSGES